MGELLALDCPKCGAGLGPALPSGEHLCDHCGDRSRPKVEVVHVAVPHKPTFNVVPTAAEVAERNKTFSENSARDQRSREKRAQREAASAASSRTVMIVIVVILAVVAVLVVGGGLASFFLLR